jgi:Tfp pilus assembly ATPase PilU
MDINRYLRALAEKGGSDLFFSVGAPVTLKREGDFFAFGNQPLAAGAVRELAWQVMNEKQIEEFEREQEMNLAVGLPNLGRFRINVFYQRSEVGMVVRHISNKIPAFADLGLPQQLERLALKDRGLVLVVGATGSGKSTKDSMNRGQEPGLQSFDQHLYDLLTDGKITMEMALRYADSPTDLKLKSKFSDTRSESPLGMPQQPEPEAELSFKPATPGNEFSDSDLTDDFR